MLGHQKFKIQKCKDLPILSKLDCSCRKSCGNEVSMRVLSEYAIISECVEKSVLRIRGSLNIPLKIFHLVNCASYTFHVGKSL